MKKSAVRILSMLLTLVMLFSSAALPYAFAEQVLITEKTPLLDKNGALTKPGYCFNNMYEYDRSAIKANPTRIKEWDFLSDIKRQILHSVHYRRYLARRRLHGRPF